MANNDLISRSRLLRDPYFQEDRYPESHLLRMAIKEAHAVDAVEVTGQEIQFLIDGLCHHVRWMKAAGANNPECGYDERVALLERLVLFESEHFPDMKEG